MKSGKVHYGSSKDILKYHGIFILIFYWFFKIISHLLYFRWWNKISHFKYFYARDSVYNKSKPWWQDIGIFIHAILACIVILFHFYSQFTSILIIPITVYLLIDILVFYIRVLWFDDLGIGFTENERMVWSHRRLLFQAIVNFAETILLFCVFYKLYTNKPFPYILQNSFSIATTLSRGDFCVPNWIVNCQVLVSIFYLIVVISVISSIAYSRPEIGKSFDNN